LDGSDSPERIRRLFGSYINIVRFSIEFFEGIRELKIEKKTLRRVIHFFKPNFQFHGSSMLIQQGPVELFRFYESPHGLRTACFRILERQDSIDNIFPENDPTGDFLIIYGDGVGGRERKSIVQTLESIADRNGIAYTINTNCSRRGSSTTASSSTTTTSDVNESDTSANESEAPQQSPQLQLNLDSSSIAKKLIVISMAGVAAHKSIEIEKPFFLDRHLLQFETRILKAFGRDIKNDCVVAFGLKHDGRPKFIWLADAAALSLVNVENLTVFFSSNLKLFDKWVKTCQDADDIGTRMPSFAPAMVPGHSKEPRNIHQQPSDLVIIAKEFFAFCRDFLNIFKDFFDDVWLRALLLLVIMLRL
jgi:hypothetical protein